MVQDGLLFNRVRVRVRVSNRVRFRVAMRSGFNPLFYCFPSELKIRRWVWLAKIKF